MGEGKINKSQEKIDERVKTLLKKQSYFQLLKNYGILSVIFSWDFIPSVILTAIICKYYLCFSGFTESVNSIILSLIGANASLLGIVLAGYAITISLSHGKFFRFLEEQNILDDIVFLFSHASIIVGLGLISTVLLALLQPIDLLLSKILFVFSIFFTLYGVLSIILLLLNMKRYAFLRGIFSKIEDKYN